MNYSMSAFAALFHLKRERIRYYERLGLLPAPQRTQNGYRTYSDADAERLFFILLAKRHGFTLREIKTQLLGLLDASGGCEPDLYWSVIRKKQAQVEAQIEKLNREAALLREVGAALKAGQANPCAAMELYLSSHSPIDMEV